jgi:hypothetical protein
MPESRAHMDFVEKIYSYIAENVSERSRGFIEVDSPDSLKKPQRTYENFVPDVLLDTEDYLIIGEAKTANDVDRNHSISQYTSYLRACDCHEGNCFIVVCVSWDTFISVKNIFRKIKQDTGSVIRVHILSENGMEDDV